MRVVVAGASGHLGGLIARELRVRGAETVTLVRPSSPSAKVQGLIESGLKPESVNFEDAAGLIKVLKDADCVVSALAGLAPTILDAQRCLLDAAVVAKVPRFIPSDFSIDFTKLKTGENRNLDLRRRFHEVLDKAPIRATSIFNGAFMDMLTGQAPLILFKFNRVLYWGDPDQRLDFTSITNTAAFTAACALDVSSPRFLHIAGEQLSARQLAATASTATGRNFALLRGGSINTLSMLSKIMRLLTPEGDALYPPWQGMQYLKNMFEGHALAHELANDRYPLVWTKAADVLNEVTV